MNTLCVQLFYIILYAEDEHFVKTLYEDLGFLPGAFLLFLSRLADAGLKEKLKSTPDRISIKINKFFQCKLLT